GTSTCSCQLPVRPPRTATRRPSTRRPSRPPPDSSTTPTPSKPGVAGSTGLRPYCPRMNSKSDGLTGLASIRTRTWPRAGFGSGRSRTWSTCSGSPQRSNTMAFILVPSPPCHRGNTAASGRRAPELERWLRTAGLLRRHPRPALEVRCRSSDLAVGRARRHALDVLGRPVACLPAGHQIDDPAAADVRPRPAEVGQRLVVRPAALFEGVGQDG